MIAIKNLRSFQRSLEAAAQSIVDSEVVRMEAAADRVEAQAASVVGVETGALRDSGEVHPTEREGDAYVSRVTFGGASAPYAGIVHDAPWSASEGFLSDAARDCGWPAR